MHICRFVVLLVQDYIVDSVLPTYHVDTAPFKTFVRRLTAGRVAPRCRQTFTRQLEARLKKRKQDLINVLKTVDRVCTTADCWTSRRRSFLGITVHWLNQDTLERHSACLSVKQLSGRHTFDVLAKHMSEVNDDFGITNKTCFTVTDNGANFVKAFRYAIYLKKINYFFSHPMVHLRPTSRTGLNGQFDRFSRECTIGFEKKYLIF